MNDFLIAVVTPLGQVDQVIAAANTAGATGATILHAREVENSVEKGLFHIKVEPEQAIILIAASKEVAEVICQSIHNELGKNPKQTGSIYILQIQGRENSG
jgi:nitrogen regulatory protein PII-like uncharacterized protein